MNPSDVKHLIEQVVAGEVMDSELLKSFIESVASRNVEISLVEQWLKVVHKHGISVSETTQLTKGMMLSGSIIQWEDNSLVVDKHSTGGVGDKMSLMLAPILAACGLKVPMLAGRGLGHTGGTIDKLESIPGFDCSLTPQQMQQQVEEIGCCIAAQNSAIAPADGLLYAIRDVTGTIDSIPLITASIISKKAAEGLGSLVLDVKCGSAAFMQTLDDATELAKSMVGAAKGLGINTVAQITEMDYPIGKYVGNSLEIIGSIEVLQGKGSQDTFDLVKLQCQELLVKSGQANSHSDAELLIQEVIDNGEALAKFKEMCMMQGVSQTTAQQLVDNPTDVLKSSQQITEITAEYTGFLQSIDSMTLADIARKHGAGRYSIEDEVVPEIGFEILAQRGAKIDAGDVWLKFHHNEHLTDEELAKLTNSLKLSSQKITVKSRLIHIVD